MATERIDRLTQLLEERIVVLDGSWGVLLQGRGITEDDWRGERFADHSHDVKGNPDLLNLTKPDLVSEIHRAYFDAGLTHLALRMTSWNQAGQLERFLNEIAPALTS